MEEVEPATGLAGVFEAAAVSVALREDETGELVFQAAWGTAAEEIVGVRLSPGEGIAGAALASGEPIVVPECRSDSRFADWVAAGTRYVPNTLLAVRMLRGATWWACCRSSTGATRSLRPDGRDASGAVRGPGARHAVTRDV